MKIDKKTIVAIIMVIIILITTTVNAKNESSFVAEVISDKKNVNPGDEITVTMTVSDINMGENGINTIEGMLDYDKTIFEEIKSKDIKGLNNWSVTYNDEDDARKGKFLFIKFSEGVKSDESVISITFKVKSNIASVLETTINFKDITSNDGENLVDIGNKSVKISVNSDGAKKIENENSEQVPEEQNTGIIPVIATSVIVTILVAIFGIKKLR